MQNKLPADPSALILGIIGLVIGLAGCCCYGITAIIPLGLSIVGLVMANKSLKLYRVNPGEYSESSRSNVGIAKVINIISIVLNGLFLLIIIGVLAFVGMAGLQGAFDDFRNLPFENANEWEENSGSYEDEYNYDEEYNMEEVDSLRKDSIYLYDEFPDMDSLN